MSRIVPVILSGGSGTRLWPLSREHYPKQLLALTGSETLLQQTARRLNGLPDISAPVVVCNEEHRFLIAEQLREIDQTPVALMLEPTGRNTAPALTVAALHLAASDQQAVMLVMPADHVIADPDIFQETVKAACPHAAQGKLVTFGVVPTAPETGYGYIRRGQSVDATAFSVANFVEKPDSARAHEYLDSGQYLWNSGIFMMTADSWLSEMECHRPDILSACRLALNQATRDSDFTRLDKELFQACPSDSIDYAVMEKTSQAVVVPLAARWSDVGAWSSLWQVLSHDGNGNAVRGDVLMQDVRNSIVFSEHRLVAGVGVRDLVIIETADAVLVTHRDRAQDVKDIVQQLKRGNRPEAVNHRRVYRPWGHYDSVDQGDRFQVKRITVNPHAALSLQMHHKRAEHWVVVKGRARVTRGEDVFVLEANQSTYIPIGTRHRLENPDSTPLEMIEVQSGAYLGEDDIVRFEDKYHRQ
jgi:mannose-1-phosphate guanylyltransferase/mannose-6-phosphate isomerase